MNKKKRFLFFPFFLALFSLSLFSCAKLSTVDKSYLNHRAMNLDKGMTDEPSSAYTNLGSGGTSSQAGCATCAK